MILKETGMLGREMVDLPEEIICEVFSHFDFAANGSVAGVCRFFKNLSHDNLFWKKKFLLHFPHVLTADEQFDWRELFIKTYQYEYQFISKHIRHLFSLVKEGDLAAIRCVDIKIDNFYCADRNNFSLVIWAFKKNNRILLDYFYELIKKQLHEGSDFSLLHWAVLCRCSQAEIKIILQSVDIDAPSKFHGNTALHLAAKNGFADTVEFLLGCNANINFHNHVLHDALLVAIKSGHKNVVDILLKHNAEMLAIHLHEAVEKRRLDVVAALLDKGMNIDILGEGATPLMMTIKQRDMQMVEFLLDHGANINARSASGATPLLFAAEYGCESIASFLLERNADTSLALLRASSKHLEFGVMVGDTPLHAAARLGHDEIVRLLLENNADVTAVNEKGQKPADMAKENCKYRFLHQNHAALVF